MKKRYLFLTILICALTLMLAGCVKKDNTPVDNTPKVGIPVSEAKANVEELEGMTITMNALVDINVSETVEQHEAKLVVQLTSEKAKLEVTYEEKTIELYVLELQSQNPLFVFNISMITDQLPEQWISISFEEIVELVTSNMNPDVDYPQEDPSQENPSQEDPSQDLPVDGSYEELITEILSQVDQELLSEVTTFLSEINDEYFDVEGEYYVFNAEGKAVVSSLVDRIFAEASRLFPEQGIDETYQTIKDSVEISYDIKVKTGNKYIKAVEVSVEVKPVVEENAGEYVKASASVEFSEYGTTQVVEPEDITTFEDFQNQFPQPE